MKICPFSFPLERVYLLDQTRDVNQTSGRESNNGIIQIMVIGVPNWTALNTI
jgi:hypothetical protein